MNMKILPTSCPIDISVQILSSKWTIAIIRELMIGPKRPSDLERRLKGISAKTLSERLHDLQSWGLVERQSHAEVPPRVEYSLTDLGKKLETPMEALKAYGQFWQKTMESSTYDDTTCNACPSGEGVNICPAAEDLHPKNSNGNAHSIPVEIVT
jgi:DNA-binding HxlR family transcriptional regulator